MRVSDITMLEQISTARVETPNATAFVRLVVIASAGVKPNKRINVGFSDKIPFENIFQYYD